jgi:hypothetical protein
MPSLSQIALLQLRDNISCHWGNLSLTINRSGFRIVKAAHRENDPHLLARRARSAASTASPITSASTSCGHSVVNAYSPQCAMTGLMHCCKNYHLITSSARASSTAMIALTS